jgi:hypothetical protein
MPDWETLKAEIKNEEKKQEWIASRMLYQGEGPPPDLSWEELKEKVARATEARLQEESESSPTEVEAKPKPQPKRTEYLSAVLFGLLGLLTASQVYTWKQLKQIAASGQQREARSGAVEADLQKDVEKERTALDRAYQQMATQDQAYQQQLTALTQAYQRAVSRQPETKSYRSVAAMQEQTKPNTVSKVAGQQSMRNAGTGLTVSVQGQPATAPGPFSRDVSATRRDAPATGNELQDRTKGFLVKLSPSVAPVARDHNEVVQLRKLGKRDYIEFTLVPSPVRQEVAPGIGFRLKKVDVKNLRCTLSIYADDYELTDNQGVGEAVSFPTRAGSQSVQLAIMQVNPDGVVGYLSSLKGVLATGK